jgi:hypothetical protein
MRVFKPQPVKQDGEIASIDEQLWIDNSDPQWAKADSSSLKLPPPASNVTLESLWQPQKQDLQMRFKDEGIESD